MLDFSFTAEQEELARTLRAFARKELAPRSAQWDRSGEFPWDAWRQMGELGLLGLRAPAALGGQDADLVTAGIAVEEIARGDFCATYGIQLAAFAAEIIGRNGTDEVRERWIPPTTRGETVIALALTEPSAGSDASHLACRAERDGDDYVITGEKSGISLGMVAQAAIVFARTDPDARARGISAFLVPARPRPASRGVPCATSAPTSSSAPCCRSTTCAFPPRTGSAPRARASARSCRPSTSTAC